VTTRGGAATVDAFLGDPLRVQAQSDAMRLDQIIEEGPSLTVSGIVTLTQQKDDPGFFVHADMGPTAYSKLLIPSFQADGTLLSDAFVLHNVTANTPGSRVRGSGKLVFDGAAAAPRQYDGALRGVRINALAQSPRDYALYAATDNGLFRVDSPQGPVLKGLAATPVSSIVIAGDAIYAGTSRGLFKIEGDNEQERAAAVAADHDASLAFKVQEAALRYNQVHPAKISAWRRRVKARALLPALSLDYDRTMNYDSKNYRYIEGPNDWGISIKWDLGDLLWNSYEDDIDTRARLDTQMRLDIVDEVNRLYFDLVRVRRELNSPNLTPYEGNARRLRLQELSASLDGYTGGWFSRQMRPE